jgi:NADPH-dependent glutamate synthase beta subunit-like oxidoreductase/Pyruvate/2-oxoacid:ferredoxin oxidoreductase delta subunit
VSDRKPSSGGAPSGPERLTPAFRPVQREKTAPCQAGCATSGDVRGWIATVAQREKLGLSLEEAYARAWGMITEVNPFPSVMGRVCPHPCEDHCNRTALDEPLAINAMERFLGDWALAEALPLERPGTGTRDESIGVVGAGPSGLSFAYQLARRGYPVTVYEGREKAGGMLRYGIPDYRLPPEVLDAEIDRILALGVDLRLGTRIGRDVTLEDLREKHDALYLGIGAQRGRGLGIPGEEGPGVWTGTEYLSRVNQGERVEVGESVAVIGGGNTAIDAARAARRAGARVTLLYRRSREEMPAIAHEIDDALEEGVDLVLLAAPVRIGRENGRPATLVAQRMELGEPDASGRRRPVPISGSEFEVPVDSVIAAVSQEPELAGLETLAGTGGWLLTDGTGSVGDGVWAGGDALGLGIAGFAIAQGRRAAEALHARLNGSEWPGPGERGPEVGPDRINLGYHETRSAAHPPRLDPAVRLADPGAEVSGRITEEEFLEEADRCFSCGSCFGCQQCSMYCTSGCYIRLEQSEPGVYFALSLDQCEECGKCIEVCPCGFLDVIDG